MKGGSYQESKKEVTLCQAGGLSLCFKGVSHAQSKHIESLWSMCVVVVVAYIWRGNRNNGSGRN